jgi:TRAP-type C4-dicarboxylate transport system substrate-binding protein
MKRQMVCLGMAVFFALSLLWAGNAPAQAPKPIELTFNHFLPSVGLMTDEYKKWGDMVEKRSNGRLKIKWFWSNSLFSMTEALPSVAAGVADFGVASGAYFPTQLPTVLALEHAYNSSDVYVGIKAQTMLFKQFPDMEKEFERNGVLRAAPYGSGTFQFYLKGTWASSADFKGKVGRTMGGGRAVWYEKMGLKPVFMAITDVYEAVERGALWGFENTLNLSNDLKLYEVINTLVPLNSGTVMSSYTIMNLKKFQSLPPDLQKILIDTGVDWAENSLAKALYEKEQGIQQDWITKRGIKVVKPQADDLAYIKKTGRDAALELAKKQDVRMGTPGKTENVLQTLWKFADQEEQIVATKGHPWK